MRRPPRFRGRRDGPGVSQDVLDAAHSPGVLDAAGVVVGRAATVAPVIFDFAHSSVPVRREIRDEFRREWDRMANPGSTWTGAERVALAAAARSEGADDSALPDAAVVAAARIYHHPASPTREWVEATSDTLGVARYVELVGVVARLAAVDGFHRALGLTLEPLPEPVGGDPTGEIDDRARAGAAWVPMVGGSSIVGALSIVPPEAVAQEQLHGPMYLTYPQMGDVDFRRGLHRSQIELVAARASALNECFY